MKPTVVLSGSFRKSYPDIARQAAAFEALGIAVLSPKISTP